MNSPSLPTAPPIVVLLCEDEPIIIMSTTALLEDDGMTVVEATSIAEARVALVEPVWVLAVVCSDELTRSRTWRMTSVAGHG